MTEYEIADLAASKAFELQGGVSLFQTQITMIADGIQQYMSILFGYIATPAALTYAPAVLNPALTSLLLVKVVSR